MNNPFCYGTTIGPVGFVNRKADIERLSRNMINGINTMLISPRRWGKSSLVLQTLHQMKHKQVKDLTAKMDLFSVRTEEEFLREFAKSCLRATSSRWDDIFNNARELLGKITPAISIDTKNPESDLSFEFHWQSKPDPEVILNLPQKIAEKKKKRVIVCIDEFQNLASLPDPVGFQKVLRSYWQQHQNVSYCLYGSKRHILNEFFTDSSMPFYRFGDIMWLEKIAEEHWTPFISDAFLKTGKEITEELAAKISLTMDLHPYYVQQMAYFVWNLTEKTVVEQTISEAIEEMVRNNDSFFISKIEGMPDSQIGFIKALIDGIDQFSSTQNLHKYHLGTSANVIKIRKYLTQKEIIDQWQLKTSFADPVFPIWFKRRFGY